MKAAVLVLQSLWGPSLTETDSQQDKHLSPGVLLCQVFPPSSFHSFHYKVFVAVVITPLLPWDRPSAIQPVNEVGGVSVFVCGQDAALGFFIQATELQEITPR